LRANSTRSLEAGGSWLTMGDGEGSGGGAGVLWAIIWFLLIFVTWWLSFLVAWFYIILLPFSGCFQTCGDIEEALLRVVKLPKTCGQNMVAMKPLC